MLGAIASGLVNGWMYGSMHNTLRDIRDAVETDDQRNQRINQTDNGGCLSIFLFGFILVAYWKLLLIILCVCVFAVVLYLIFKEDDSEKKPLTRGSYDWYINEFLHLRLDSCLENSFSKHEFIQMHSAVSKFKSENKLTAFQSEVFNQLTDFAFKPTI